MSPGLVSHRPSVLYRGLKASPIIPHDIFYGDCRSFRLRKGDLLTLVNVDGGAGALLLPLADTSNSMALELIGLDSTLGVATPLLNLGFAELAQVLSARNILDHQLRPVAVFDENCDADERFVFTAMADCQLFVMMPVQHLGVEAGAGGHVRLEIKHGVQPSSEPDLPEPLGRVVDEWRVPRATALAYEVRKGQFLQVIDVEGQQCSDFMAMRADALDKGIERYIDSTVTRSMTHGAYPRPGTLDKFYDQNMQALLSVRQDTVGRHDTFALACTGKGYEERGFPGHINCSDNISEAYEPFGIASRAAWPAINFFFNSSISSHDNLMSADESWSRPGDYVVMEALTDLVCVSTACPDDVDPINGWNPTDVHVRIYEEKSEISKSIYYRAQPDDEGKMTRQSAFHPRTSQLTSQFHVARDVWMPAHYDATGAVSEYWACRETATLQDMSSLRKFDIAGPDAERLLQHCMTRNIAKLAEHRGMYCLMCDERGSVIDDGTLFRLSPDVFRWCCGSDNSALHLQEQARELGLRVFVKSLSDKMPNLALQGPRSRDILKEIVFTQPTRPALENVKWFGFTIARLHDVDGPAFMLTRSGFTGELGYEIFCDEKDALTIWDALVEAGEKYKLKIMGGDALNMLRIEAGLMISGAEFGPDSDALESGLGFAIDFKKEAFIGRDALVRNQGSERKRLMGLLFPGDDVPAHGAPVFAGREQVGVVTSATRSPELGHAIALARLAVENAEIGTDLQVGCLDGHVKRLPCTVTSIPFIDPRREKARA
ncbi:MAG: DUF1989 domain-containing protein [Pseudomonadota bacterium]